jgi:RNA polymerase sigma-70 factor (ECF subfamily)
MNSDFTFLKLKQGDKDAFDFIFREYYQRLIWFALKFIHDKDKAEEFVQAVFVKLWEERKEIVITTSLKAYLYKSVQNKCLDSIKHDKIRHRHEQIIQNNIETQKGENAYSSIELQEKIEDAINRLPEKTREIFRLSRFDDKKYREIAEILSISVKTVEAHVGKALSVLRYELDDWL